MRGNQGVALSQRVCTVAASTVVHRVVHHGGTYGVDLDIALTQQSIGIFLHQRRRVTAVPQRAGAVIGFVDVPHGASPWRGDEPGDVVGLRWSQQQMHRVAHEHVGVQGATAFLRASPRQ
jgi:hypothetical protein